MILYIIAELLLVFNEILFLFIIIHKINPTNPVVENFLARMLYGGDGKMNTHYSMFIMLLVFYVFLDILVIVACVRKTLYEKYMIGRDSKSIHKTIGIVAGIGIGLMVINGLFIVYVTEFNYGIGILYGLSFVAADILLIIGAINCHEHAT